MKRTLRLPHRDLKATLDHDLSLPVPSMTDSAPHDRRSGRGLHDEAAVLQAVARGGQSPAATPVARLISGEVINCDFNRVLNAGDARRRIATILGKAVASVDISVAGNVLEDSDSLDGLNMEIVLSDRRVMQEFVEAVGTSNFGLLRDLSTLRIMYNKLSALPERICHHLRDLRHLDIYRAGLCDLPDGIGQLSGLQTLNLSCNRLTTLPNTLGQLVWLSELDLGHNALTALPETFAQLQGLHHLDLRFNWLTALPDNIGLLTWVRRVNVVVNCLTHLPQSIVHLEWLQCLYLEWNQLEELPAGFGQLVRLRELHLRGNRIAALPDGFGDLLRLEVPETEGNYPKLTVPQVPPRLSRVTF